jgi:hypothetical protein
MRISGGMGGSESESVKSCWLGIYEPVGRVRNFFGPRRVQSVRIPLSGEKSDGAEMVVLARRGKASEPQNRGKLE